MCVDLLATRSCFFLPGSIRPPYCALSSTWTGPKQHKEPMCETRVQRSGLLKPEEERVRRRLLRSATGAETLNRRKLDLCSPTHPQPAPGGSRPPGPQCPRSSGPLVSLETGTGKRGLVQRSSGNDELSQFCVLLGIPAEENSAHQEVPHPSHP